ncbi:50S ribosomal protein L24 [bacterium]|nr:50S ribosomal protein L24 [bacterium]
MKLQLKDKVIVISGRDRGKTGQIVAVLPKHNQVVVEGVNVAKRHTKPNAKQPKGGIIETVKPIDVSKVMVVDPATGRPARVGYKVGKNGSKERVFKVSKFVNKKTKPAKKDEGSSK